MSYIKYIPLALFIAQTVKAMLPNAGWLDAVCLAILGIISAYYEFKSQHGTLTKHEEQIEALVNKSKELETKLDETKTHVAGLKIGTQMRYTNVR